MNNRIDIVFGIVTYKEIFWKTVTFQNLVNSIKKFTSLNRVIIYIVDNTDIEDWHVEVPKEYKDFVIYEKMWNPGISVAYNKIQKYALNNNIEWLVLLDQDTTLPTNMVDIYLKSIDCRDVEIKVPIVYIEKGILSPSKYRNYHSFLFKKLSPGIISFKDISCINTGLMINTIFFKEVGGYNENLKLDFCDHDFIERAKKKSDKLEILDINLYQDFSSITHTKKQAIERYKRYINDFKVFRKNRNKLLLFLWVDFPRLLKLTIKYKTLAFLRIRIQNL
jgi:glycosyltransferase, group 2 family